MKYLVLALVAGVLGGCGSAPQPPTPAASVASIASGFNPTDAAWLGLMIPMNEQFLRIVGYAPTNSKDPAVRRLAAELTVGHQAELKQLIALRDRAGLPTTNAHAGHNMPGMMTEEEVLALQKLRGPAFDKVLRAEVKDHLTQSALISRSAKAAGQEPTVKTLATTIEKNRTAQAARLA
ncbi:DUF305 domain-containing protein [Kribbella albertanoniae]|uniref:DUF305 domain-containing protein n=1 Tax=Kribbella albertanoniae TaxID=1266829 RepID=A0A4V2XQ42_9ACTN|nr:DUF305 domain-containing protein [Kribbella albertanoniae]TDC24465.1 DUF305 domain-containing protein [Kribbella albertanoniae]